MDLIKGVTQVADVEKAECPILFGNSSTSIKVTLDDPDTTLGYAKVTCTYNDYAFTDSETVDEYRYNFLNPELLPPSLIQQNVVNFNEALAYTCSRLTDQGCPASSTEGICSVFVSSTEEGAICRSWAEEFPRESDTVKQTVCSERELFECACLYSSRDPNYNEMKDLISYPDVCWYRPCDIYTQDVIRLSQPSTGLCPYPETMCSLLIDTVLTNEEAFTPDVVNTMFCLDKELGIVNSTFVIQNREIVVNDTESENEVAGEKAWTISIIVGSVVLLILLIVLLALAVKKNK
jgi:hypothetical protein